jgi:hypothetical protein
LCFQSPGTGCANSTDSRSCAEGIADWEGVSFGTSNGCYIGSESTTTTSADADDYKDVQGKRAMLIEAAGP